MADSFPPKKLRVALIVYSILWWVLLPVVLYYLFKRSLKDPLYRKHIGERLGRYQKPVNQPVWVHAVSLGEMRSATPLIRALLAKGETIITTHFTPAGRREAEREFADEIAAGQVQTVWVPFEYGFSYARFLKTFEPKYGLVMEIEIWPRMIMACRDHSVPLFMCNAQYPQKSFVKDQKGLGLRAALVGGFAGGFVKSSGQEEKFTQAGMRNIHVTGELRFDQPIPRHHIEAADNCRAALVKGRPSFTLTSVVEGEDALYIDMMCQTEGVFFTYVPRAPERFDEVAQILTMAGRRFAKRSDLFDDALQLSDPAPDIDVLLGDSMGEMYFYLGLCDRAIIGGGFVKKGAHNIIEPLALKKPVIVGPHIWTIEYPATEAIAAGVCQNVLTPDDLLAAVKSPVAVTQDQITAFYDEHAGGVDRTLAVIPEALKA